MLSLDGISTNPEKVQMVKNWPKPKIAKEVHSFLGLASYYQHFMDHFASKAWCLHDLIGPDATKSKCWGKNIIVKH